MYKGKSFLAIIPARGGSKGLPRKNILDLNGLPVISHTILAAKQSKYIDRVLVTSEDVEILDISQAAGAEIIERPVELASDTATTIDTVVHAIKKSEKVYDYIVLLQPTSPLRVEKHIDEAIELLKTKKADAVVSVCKMEHSPLWSNTLDSSLSMNGFIKNSVYNKRRQDMEDYYRLNGAIYICNTSLLLHERRFILKKNTYAYKMSKRASVDIDNELDFKICKCLESPL